MDKRISFNDTVDNWLELSGDGLHQFYEADLHRRSSNFDPNFDPNLPSSITVRPNRRLCDSPVRNFATTPAQKNFKHGPSIKVEREAISLTPMPALIENKRPEASSERHHRKKELTDSESTFNKTFNDGTDGNESIRSLVRYVKNYKGKTGDEINNYVMKYCHERSAKNFIPPSTPGPLHSNPTGRHCDTCCCQPEMQQFQEQSQMQMQNPAIQIREPERVRIVQQKRKGMDFEDVNEALVGRIKVQQDDFTPSLNSSPDTVILANGDIDKTMTPKNGRGYDIVTGRCLKPEFDNCLTGTNEKKRQPVVTSLASLSSPLPSTSSTTRQNNKTPTSMECNYNESSSANGSMSPEQEDCSFTPMEIPIVLTLACPRKPSKANATNSQPIRVMDVQTSMGTCCLFDTKPKPIFGIRKNVKFQEPSSEKARNPTPNSSKANNNANSSGPRIQLELKGTISNWRF